MSESHNVRFPFMNLISPAVWAELATIKKYLPLLLNGMDMIAFEASWYRENGQVNNQRMVEFRDRVRILDEKNPIDFYSTTVFDLTSRLYVRRQSAVSEEQYVNDLYNEIIDLVPLEMDARLLEDVLSPTFGECSS